MTPDSRDAAFRLLERGVDADGIADLVAAARAATPDRPVRVILHRPAHVDGVVVYVDRKDRALPEGAVPLTVVTEIDGTRTLVIDDLDGGTTLRDAVARACAALSSLPSGVALRVSISVR